MEKTPIPKVMRLARVPDGENPLQASARIKLEPGSFGPMRGVWAIIDGQPRFYPESVIDRIDCAYPAEEVRADATEETGETVETGQKRKR